MTQLLLLAAPLPGGWLRSSSSDPCALAVVDGTGPHAGAGAHYSRRSPGSRTFTGVGQEIVLLHESGLAVWAVVRQKTPSRRGSGVTRGRAGVSDAAPQWVWRNMLFRRLDGCPVTAQELVETATRATYIFWREKYAELPQEKLRTEVDAAKVRSTNPGCCYKRAGYTTLRWVRTKLYLQAPEPTP